MISRNRTGIQTASHPFYIVMMCLIWAAFTVKVVLQLLSVYPEVARLAYQFPSYVIAYLHLVLLGIIVVSPGLVWKRVHKPTKTKPAFILFVVGLAGMELVLFAAPSWTSLSRFPSSAPENGIMAFSTALWISAGWFMYGSLLVKRDV